MINGIEEGVKFMGNYDLKRVITAVVIFAVASLLNTIFGFVFNTIFRILLANYLFYLLFQGLVSALSYILAFAGVSLVVNKGKINWLSKACAGYLVVFVINCVLICTKNLFGLAGSAFSFLLPCANYLWTYLCLKPSASFTASHGKNEKTTLYRKGKFYTDDSPFAKFAMWGFMMFWAMGIVCIFASFIVRPRSQAPGLLMVGLGCLLVAVRWTKAKIEENNIKTYKKIVLPEHWPADCSYEGYKNGLNKRVAIIGGGQELKFYEHCQKEGIQNMNGELNQQKALLIAQNMKIKDVNLAMAIQMFEDGKKVSMNNESMMNDHNATQSLNQKRIEELNTLADVMKFYGPHGRDKRIMMLNDLRAKALEEVEKAKMMQRYVNNTMIQKEHDWAVHGGIASVAGVGASIATVADIQAKNAQIRAQNQANMPYVAMMTSHYGKNAEGYQAQADHYAQEIVATKDKLVKDDNMQDIFNHLVITDAKTTVSSTGAVKVSAKFKKSESYRIYETLDPAIDGTVAARLYQNGVCAGSAYFVLPVDGITTEVELTSISTKPSTPNAKYEVRFEPVDVWAIERM